MGDFLAQKSLSLFFNGLLKELLAFVKMSSFQLYGSLQLSFLIILFIFKTYWSPVAIPSNPRNCPFLYSFLSLSFLFIKLLISLVFLIPSGDHRILGLEGMSRPHPSLDLFGYIICLRTSQVFKWCSMEPETVGPFFSILFCPSWLLLLVILSSKEVLRIENDYSLGM